MERAINKCSFSLKSIKLFAEYEPNDKPCEIHLSMGVKTSSNAILENISSDNNNSFLRNSLNSSMVFTTSSLSEKCS